MDEVDYLCEDASSMSYDEGLQDVAKRPNMAVLALI